jgi:hypothetical protein
MNARTSHEEIKAMRMTRDRAASLLTRYPALSRDESKEVLRFLKSARHLDVGLLSSDDAVRPRLDAFLEDHKKHLGVTALEAGWVIGLILAFLAVCWMLWEIGADHLS